jgi:outer membrane protein assembly factor BamC
LQLEEGFDNAWRRVGATLDRTGFAVEDRDRKKGIYFVRYAVPADKSKKGFFAQMFSSDEPDVNDVIKLQIAVRSEGNVSKVTVLNEKGEPATPATIQNVLKTLVGDMR